MLNFIVQTAILITFLLGFRPVLHAQPSGLEVRITASYQEESLENILSDLTERTRIEFSYSSNRIPVGTKITASFSNETLSGVLEELFRDLPIRYELMDDYIILKKGKIQEEMKNKEEARHFTLNGFIKDRETGEFLIGATVFIPEMQLGAVTNNYGFFSLTLPVGKYTLKISYIGYEEYSVPIDLGANMKFDFKLMPGMNFMEEVIISSVNKEELRFKKVASQSEVMPEQIKKLPALLGESDVLKNLELQAGINYYGDGSSYFHVRGGQYDQNLILLDDAMLYNPSHLLGIFSPIIPDAVKSVDIYKAGMPARYGGRLSSVIDIRTREGNMNKFSASGSVGIISARMAVEGPLKKGKSSYFLSFRRSYFDVFLKSVIPNLRSLYFNDLTAKFNIRLGPRDRLFLTLYRGSDVFRLNEGNNQLSGLDWTNNSTTLRWNRILGSKMFMNMTLFGSTYDYYLRNSLSQGTYWNSKITNLSLKEDFTYFASPRFSLNFGARIGAYKFNPGNYSSADNREQIQVSPVSSADGAIFAGIEQELFKWLVLHYGLRFSAWVNAGKAFVARFNEEYQLQEIDYYLQNQRYYNHTELEPRLSASVKLNEETFLKMSYSRTVQYINLISNSVSPLNSFEVWLPVGPNIHPQKADIYDFGLVRGFEDRGLNLQADLFWKRLYNQIGYTYHANMLMNPLVEGEIRQGDGLAYGLEFSIQKESDKLKTQLAYTFLRSFLQIEGLNGGEAYPATQDRPHSFNLSFGYQAKPRWLITGSVNFASGAHVTSPTSFYYYRGYQVPVFSEQNNDRLPPYGRIDLASSFQLNKASDRYNHSLTFAIYNLFARQNPIFLYYNKMVDAQGNLLVPSDHLNPEELTTSIRYTFIFMPSVTYQFNF